jgi:hypothetical protein
MIVMSKIPRLGRKEITSLCDQSQIVNIQI